MYRLGIDIGGTKVNVGLLNAQRQLVFQQAERLPEDKSVTSVLQKACAVLSDYLQAHAIEYRDIISCGIGIPGTVSGDGKQALKVPNIGWENEPMGTAFEKMTGIPTRLIQDSRAAAYGEYAAGNGKGKRLVVCLTLGTGLGTGIVINGQVFHGALGSAGELGHVPVVPEGRPCGCGRRGCLEKYAAGLGLDITAQEMYGKGHTAASLFEKAKAGDEAARQVLREAVDRLGHVLVAMVNLLSPDCLLFSGGMSEQRDLLVQPLMDYITAHGYASPGGERLMMDYAALGADAPMIGAALYPAMESDTL